MNTENRVRVHLDSFAHLGEAIGRVDGQIIFVLGGLPGEEVVAEIFQRHSDYLRGRLVEVLTPSPDRTEPPCPYFGRCGGCQLQHVNYTRQLELKHAVVVDQLRRIGGFADADVLPVLGMSEPWYYRNHARFSSLRDGTLGFTLAHSRRLLEIEHCWLMYPPINRALEQLQGHCRGLFNVSVRHGLRTGEMLISPRVKGIDPNVIATGQAYFEEELLGRRFRIAAASFFQVNTVQADVLVGKALDYLELDSDSVLVDAYCGVGTFGILAAPRARHVIGIEDQASALVDAAYNAGGLTNIEFIRGATEGVLPVLDQPVNAVIIDPPRAGCKPEVLRALIERRPRHFVYVSCEPSTLARDLRILVDGGFTLGEIQPVDMFPQTFHVETVVSLLNDRA